MSFNLGQFNELTSVVIQLQAIDPDGDPVTYSIFDGTFPPGLSLNPSTGLITGILPAVSATTIFTFTVKAEDSGIPPESSNREFQLEVINVDNDPPVWITPAGSLGSFDEGIPITIFVIADDPDVGPSSLSYNITSGSLPPGLTLTTDGFGQGVISGTPSSVVSDTTFVFDITVDDGLAFVVRSFEIEILDVPAFLGPTTELSVALTGPLKLEWKDWNTSGLIPDTDIFNIGDPNFGRVGQNPPDEFPKIFVINRLHTDNPNTVFNLFGPHHRTFDALIGLLDFAVVRDASDNIIYEVIYQRIVDPQIGSDFNIINEPNISSLDTNGFEIYISKNFEHLRTELKAFPNSEELPAWMTSEQIVGDPDSIIGYIPAVEVAFVKPGRGATTVERLNKIEIIEINNPTTETTFNMGNIKGDIVDPILNVGDSFFINGVEITIPSGASIFDVRDEINSNTILQSLGISSTVVAGTQFIPGPFNSSQLIEGNALEILFTSTQINLQNGIGTALQDLGFTPGIKTQTTFDLNVTTFDLTATSRNEVIRGLGHQFAGRKITIDRYLFNDSSNNTKWLKFFTDSISPQWITLPGLIASIEPGASIDILLEAESPIGLSIIEYKIISGSLPDGLIHSDGLISGTLTETAIFSHIVVRAIDSDGRFADRGFDIEIEGILFDFNEDTPTTFDSNTTTFDIITI